MPEKKEEQVTVPILPDGRQNDFIGSFTCEHVPGEVWVYKWGGWYQLVVVGSYGRGDIEAFFELKGRHKKEKVAIARAIKVAKSWGKD